MSVSDTLPIEGRLPGFEGATGWLNSPPLTVSGLRGQVVVVDFWTYTCINWLRTLGYVRAWAERYRDDGLVMVGVHTPEVPFEGDVENVRRAVSDMRVPYPVALDSDHAVWRAFSNHYWPAMYIADAEGRIRYHHFGEGAYDECERVIQRLLREAGSGSIADDLVSIAPAGVEAQADWRTWSRRRPISVPSRGGTSPPAMMFAPMCRAATPCPTSCPEIGGRSPANGRPRNARACSTWGTAASRSASTRAT
jgi:thiol-disulfide isomerase/thioredoxin